MKKLYLIFPVLFFILIVLVYFIFWPKTRFELAKEVVASGSCPYQIGLMGVMQIPCFTAGTPPVCTGGTMCQFKDTLTCTNYTDVTGMPSGGMGEKALFLTTSLQMAGVADQLIACGMAMTEMDSGVVAGMGGCVGAGCVAINEKNIFERYYEIAKYAIAKIKD